MAAPIYPNESRTARIALANVGSGRRARVGVDTTALSAALTVATGTIPAWVTIGMEIAGATLTGDTQRTIIAVNAGAGTITMSGAAADTLSNAEAIILEPPGPYAGLNGMDIRLYKSSITPGQTITEAALEAAEADFNGYAPIVGAFSVGYIPPTFNPQAISQLLTWTPTDALNANTIGGLWATDGTLAWIVWPLATAVALNTPADELSLVAYDAFLPPGGLTQVRP